MMAFVRRFGSSPGRFAAALAVAAVLAFVTLQAQVPGRNVNMVAGTGWPNGDPFLQRQNEPSIAASTRNPLHLLGGANDYRSVDIPGLPTGLETGDAWLGLFKSLDGGQRWTSTLLPGYPQDQSPQGLASPLKGYQAGADPVVRAGTSGLFYFSGLAFDRGDNGKSRIFVARFVDHNNKEAGDPIGYLGTSVVASDTGVTGNFLDKPWMAVDIPRGNNPKTCSIPSPAPPVGQRAPRPLRVPAGRVYVAFTSIVGDGPTLRAHIHVSISDDCGESWTDPVRISRHEDEVNQGATIAIDPQSGAAYVAWRRFGLSHTADNDSIMVARLPAGAKKFDTARVARQFPTGYQAFSREKKIFEHRDRTIPEAVIAADVAEFDQNTTGLSFRSNAYPTTTVDGSGRLYVAWSERGFSSARPDQADGDTRIVIATSTDGRTFTPPTPVDEDAQFGHQVMPTIAFAGGKLLLVYYDVRETRADTFGPYVSDQLSSNGRRQTIDIRSAMGTPGESPHFEPSVKVSDYLMGYRDADGPLEQLQVNPPNLPMFARGSVPFIGDYIDVTPAPAFVPTANGRWVYNTASSNAQPVFHAVWTDNRDVRPPLDGNWSNYTPVTSPFVTGPSIFDPTQQVPQCVPGNAGSRNQNIYTSRITAGLLAGSPGNTKTLSPTLQRGFVIFAQNNTTQTRTFRMTVLGQPVAGRASFTQFPLPPYDASSPLPLTSIDVRVPARSTSSRTLYVTSTDPRAQVGVEVSEIAGVGAPGPVPGGLASIVLLNPDIDNPDIDNPDIDNPDIDNPDIDNAEIGNPDIDNPDIDNPDIDNPDIDNPDIDNPDIDNVVVANPDIDNFVIGNPDIDNPDIDNPDIDNPDIDNPDIDNGSITDITWQVKNNGNTTAAFNVHLFLADAAPAGIQTQLVLHKTYKTPASSPNGCELKTETRNLLVANITNPQFASTSVPDQNDPSENNATLWLGPGESARITLRVVDPDRSDNITIVNERGETVTIDPAFNPATQITAGVASQAVPSEAAAAGVTEPPIVTPTGSNLIFLQQPTAAVAGSPVTPAVRVRVFDNAGTVLPGVTVTMALANNPTGAALIGNVAVSGLDGIASFPGLQISAAGSGYTLTATANAGSVTATATTQPFTVSSSETPSADLQVTQTHAPSTPVTDTPFTYTVVVTNNGPLSAAGVVLTDTLPAGFSVTSVMDAACTQGTGTVTCQLGALASGATAQVTITGMPTQAVLLLNTATVSSTSFDAVPTNNTSTDNTMAGAYGVCALPSFYGAMRSQYGPNSSTSFFATGDFNEDGHLDTAGVANSAANRGVQVMLGAGTGFFGAPSMLQTPGDAHGVAAADFDEDGNLDLAVSVWTTSGNGVRVFLGNGGGGFIAGPVVATGSFPMELTAADLNHDNHIDLVAGNSGPPILILLGDGDANFAVSQAPTTTDQNVLIADFDNDGNLDLAAPQQLLHALNVLRGDGLGGFTLMQSIPFATDFVNTIHPIADLNDDGRPELVFTVSSALGTAPRRLMMMTSAGETEFNAAVELLPPSTELIFARLKTADLNGDGREDLIVGSPISNIVLVLQNNGLGGFAAPLTFNTDAPLDQFAVVDANGDGRRDLLIASRQEGALVVLLNTCGGGASADIEVTLATPTTAAAGEVINYTLTVTNLGPDTATNIRDSDAIPSGFEDVGEAVCVASGGADCDGFIPMNGSVTLTGQARLLGAGVKTIRAMMTAPESDPNPVNNMATATITVSPAPLTFTVNTAADNVDGSLRDAIVRANQNTGATNRIEFSMLGSLPIVINPAFAMPTITNPVVIDGTTQPGSGAAPAIELTGLGTTGTGLILGAGSSGSTIRGLAINRWSNAGISVQSSGNVIEANHIGTDPTGTIARPNNGSGVQVAASSGNRIGGPTAAQRNVISGGAGAGIAIRAGSTNNLVQGNYIGTNTSGTAALGNGGNGIFIGESSNNTVDGNLISGNTTVGINVQAALQAPFVATGNIITGNRVGTNAAGNGAIPNGQSGVFVSNGAANTTIGGTTAAARNLISGNTGSGVTISGATSSGNLVQGNYIGTDASGLFAVPNNGLQSGVFISNAPNNTIGGAIAGAGNVVSGNPQHAVTVVGTASSNNTIQGNLIGVDATGNTRLANGGIGLDLVSAVNTTVGGPGLAANVISGNGTGVQIRTGAAGNTLAGNFIGVGRNGSIAIGNSGHGVQIVDGAFNNTIATGNTIANNGGFGVNVEDPATVGNTIRGNSIYNNQRGIDLGDDGSTPNDAGDADTGPNNLQNFPVITTVGTGSTIVDGTFNSTASTAFTLDFYGSGSCGTPQGERHLGSISVTTDAAGVATYHAVLTPTATIGEYITGTATDPAGNTSEFSGCVQVAGGGAAFDLAITQVRTPSQVVVDTDVTYTMTVINNGPFAATGVSVVIPPSGATLISVDGTGHNCSVGSGTASCLLGTLAAGASANVVLVVRPTQGNVLLVNTASVSSDGTDSNTANNSSQDSTFVSAYATCGSPTLSGPLTLSVDSTAIGLLAKGDFNEDGHIDVAVTQNTNQIAMLLGDGAGGFSPPLQTALNSNPAALVVADFNNDNHLDLAVGTGVTNAWTQQILLGQGDGTFTNGVVLPQPISTFNNEVADFNGDGNVDLVVTSAQIADSTLFVWLGNGNGTFGTGISYPSNVAPANMVIADFNHNGTLDIAVANSSATTVSILNGNGNGTFAVPVTFQFPGVVGRLREVGDVNLDGWADIAATVAVNGAPNNLMLLVNDRNGGFEPPREIIGPVNIGFTTNADFNGDGRPDLVAISFQNNQIMIMEGDGAGNFTQVAAYLTGPGQNHLLALDLNHDDRPDIVGTLKGQVYRYLNVCGGATASSVDLATTVQGPTAGTAGDTLTYQVSITNNGPAEATGVRITIAVPTGMNYLSGPASCSENWGTVICVMQPLAADASVGFSVEMHAFGAGARVLRVMATAAEADSDPSNDVGSATTTLAAAPQTFTVTNTTDGARGSLRQAIADANANTGSTNTIAFNIPNGPFSIAPLSGLPQITNPVVIDGTTQPGYVNAPIVELNGFNVAQGIGLNINAGNSTVRGLVINRWNTGINLVTNGNNVVEGNYIGTTLAGTAGALNSTGINVVSPNNRIGGTTPAQRNVISGNTNTGVNISGQVANGALVNSGAGTQVIGNYIGTNAAGTAAIFGILNQVGVRVSANNVVIGTSTARNVISGHGGTGIAAGATTLGTNSSVVVTDATGLQVRGNYIGTNASGTAAIPNGVGVNIAAGNARIGGVGAGDGNVISGNSGTGVHSGIGTTNNNTVFVSQASGVVLEGNIIGLNAAGTAALPNGGNGVQISVANNTVGGPTAAARNVISGNNGIGVNITNTTTPTAIAASGNQVVGNYIGLNLAGTAPIGNGGSGVASNGSTGNAIGGDVPGAGNVIAGNGASNNGAGVNLFGGSGHTVRGNFIGTNPAGTAAMPNAFRGVLITNSNNNTVGGTTAGARNIISGNGIAPGGGHGIEIIGSANGNAIIGNYIGTTTAGTAPLPNRSSGILLNGSTGTTVGGTGESAGNVISGNGHDNLEVGISLLNTNTNTIQGNRIGTNAAGTTAIPNANGGIHLNNSTGNTIGGTSASARNLISGNGAATGFGVGVALFNGSASNVIQNNFIGTDVTGIAALPNLGNGISIDSPNNIVGGSAPFLGNVVAFNSANGVNVASGSGNLIRSNAIFSNGSLGIDLGGNGPTTNDTGDVDTGPNNLLNYPVIALASAGTGLVSGTFNGTANSVFNLHFYASAGCDPSGYGEGQRLLGGSLDVTTDAAGNVSFQTTVTGLMAGEAVTGAATDAAGNTSEFSACATTGTTQAFVVSSSADAGPGTLRRVILDANATVGTLDHITFNLGGTPPFIIAATMALPTVSSPAIVRLALGGLP